MRWNSCHRTFVSLKKVGSTPTTTTSFAVDCLPRSEKFVSTNCRCRPSKKSKWKKKATRTTAVVPRPTPRKSLVRSNLRRLSTDQGYGDFLRSSPVFPTLSGDPSEGGAIHDN